MKKNKLFNQDGSGLLTTIIAIGALTVFGLTLNNKSILMGNQGHKQALIENRAEVTSKLYTFFTSRKNCEKYFSGVTNSSSFLSDSEISDLTNNLISVEGIQSNNMEIEIIDLIDAPDTNSVLASQIERKLRILEFDVNGSDTGFDISKYILKKEEVPILFEYAKDSTGSYQFYSCYAKDKNVVSSQAGCEVLGGSYSSSGECRLKKKYYDLETESLNETSIHNLQDVICDLEKNLNKQGQASNFIVNENGAGRSSIFCPRPEFNGCQLGTGTSATWTKPNETNITGQVVSKKGEVAIEEYLTTEIAIGNAARTARALETIDVTSSYNTDTANMSVPGGGSSSGANAATSVITGGVAYAGYAAATMTTVTTSVIATGAVGAAGGAGTLAFANTLTFFGPYGALVAIGAAIIMNTILKCNPARKLTPTYSCVNGRRELENIRMEKKKFGCKSWKCKCRWKHEKTFDAPTIGEITKGIITNTPLADVDPGWTTEDQLAEYNAVKEEILTSLSAISSQLDGVSVEVAVITTNAEDTEVVGEELVTHAGVSDMAKFYSMTAEIINEGKFSFEEFYDLDMTTNESGETPEMSSSQQSEVNQARLDINTKVDAIKTKIFSEEEKYWDELNSSVSSANTSSLSDLNALSSDCTQYKTFKSSPLIMTGNLSSGLPPTVRSTIQSKNIETKYNNLISAKQGEIDALDSTSTTYNSDKSAKETEKSNIETAKGNSTCVGI